MQRIIWYHTPSKQYGCCVGRRQKRRAPRTTVAQLAKWGEQTLQKTKSHNERINEPKRESAPTSCLFNLESIQICNNYCLERLPVRGRYLRTCCVKPVSKLWRNSPRHAIKWSPWPPCVGLYSDLLKRSAVKKRRKSSAEIVEWRQISTPRKVIDVTCPLLRTRRSRHTKIHQIIINQTVDILLLGVSL